MKTRIALLAAAGALSIFASPLAANAQVSVNINVPGLVMTAPPPPRSVSGVIAASKSRSGAEKMRLTARRHGP